ncbi:MAG: transketolase, partial [Spirochaetia bacterium]|nr:transketolase [Spirochaetia bacterium]
MSKEYDPSNPDHYAVSVIKGLVIDGVKKANSGHPGGSMSSADYAYILHKEFLNYDPDNAQWFDRDRFILSAGHESMLLYSFLTLQGRMKIDDLKQFRQWGSQTAGHPEVEANPGIECTTGPLGQGVAMSVGFASAEAMLNGSLGSDVSNHYTYVIAGDGDLQEPVALGAAATAGHLGLGKLIVFYDRNAIQISGNISRADSTDMGKVFEAMQWQVITIDGHDHDAIRKAIKDAKSETNKPTLIVGNTVMAKGCATMEGDHETHGAPLPDAEIAATKKKLGLPEGETFHLPDAVLNTFRSRWDEMKKNVSSWNENIKKRTSDAEFKKLWEIIHDGKMPANFMNTKFEAGEAVATRVAFGKVLANLADTLPNLVGGSADLEPSNNTAGFFKKVGDFTKDNRKGRNFAFGVKEFPMAAILNGIALHGGFKAFGATFLVFSDYSRGAIRLSALQHVPVLHIFTHDSFYLGEDGPTHQPIEHIPSMRAIPNLL